MHRSAWVRIVGMIGCLAPLAVANAADEPYQAAVRLAGTLGPVDPMIYGQYVEHVDAGDECVYPSICAPGRPGTDADGLRLDVVDLVRELGPPVVRWPGGCFADVYHWERGIGPRASRPVTPNGHWKGTTENHQFGTNEFLRWCERTGMKPYINVNLGSGTLEEALRWLEYCNGGPETPQGRRRAADGRVEPYGVRLWGVGNETWGSWETGHSDAATYARRLHEWTTALRKADPSIRILAVGSSRGANPAWDRTVLEQAAGEIDFLTIHSYGYSKREPQEYSSVVFAPAAIERQIRRMLTTIDEAAGPHAGRIRVALDEWNIRRSTNGKLARRPPRTFQDSLFVAGVLNALVRLSPRVGMANYVFLVNGHAPILVDGDRVARSTLFHVFKKYRESLLGEALAVQVGSPSTTPAPPQLEGGGFRPGEAERPRETPWLDAAATRRDDGTLAVALINRHPSQSARAVLEGCGDASIRDAWIWCHDDVLAADDLDDPSRILPRVEAPAVSPALRAWTCPPHSVVILTLRRGG